MLVPLGTGCASRSSVHRVRAELAATHTELTELRQAHEATAHELARVAAENRTLQSRGAEIEASLKEAREEVARLRTRVEAAEVEARTAKALATPPPPAAPVMPVAPLAPRPLAPAPPAPAAPLTPRPQRPREPVARAQTPEQAYAAALSTFRAREHGQAVLDFLDFMAKYPGHALVANAQYWIGEAYYVQRDYRQAMAEFQKVPRIAPASAKAADALLKIGLCQRNLRDEARARQTWQRVVHEFPQSEAAVKAHAFLRPEAGATRH
jgi:tol-pal system protein YbgF